MNLEWQGLCFTVPPWHRMIHFSLVARAALDPSLIPHSFSHYVSVSLRLAKTEDSVVTR